MSVTTTNGTPRFDWTPRCGVSALYASSGPSISLQFSEWRVEADSAVILPPITLHVAPAGARSSGYLELRSGLNYRVDLFVFSPGQPADFVGNSGWVQP